MGTSTIKIKLIASILITSIACKSTQVVRVNSQPTASELTAVNMTPYNVQRSPEPTPISIRNILGTDTARNLGAQSLYMYTLNTPNLVRPYVLGPWNGLCLNEPSLNHIVASVNQAVRNTQNDEFLRLQTLSAHAQRDIAMLQSDFRSVSNGYVAQINERDIAIRDAQITINGLQRNNFWSSVGFGVGGVLLGLGVSGIILLNR